MFSKKIRNIALFSVIAALLVAIGYWNISPESFLDNKPVVGPDQSAIDYYAVNARSVQFLPDGKMQYEMTADKVEHLKASEVTLLTTPDLQMYRGTTYPWHVQSERGEVNPDGSEVELIDSVRVARTDEKNRTMIITTSRMTVFPQKQYAQTEQAVRIDGAGGVTTGNGMKAYLKDGRMDLLSNVRGQYEAR
ncbi:MULTISPECIES: LPS export ABC transporter periplasmic protein LptC [Pseudomonas]|uniref:Lipopolysaccharide export system protein LptC n=1 Tax=Pseudomonas donghuensis TaxID=1163398 RepID=A0AAP0XBG6_9PSED|nr:MULTISPECIES: LPS export ABC transporter periplasmic protein LptC [Pseudomonas]MDF9891909.1 lipopolysaccharide export system protein LptC [Pseudomonas vranovensis]KDO01380.1 LPS export ABC transporter periplasmic protein LptC [Pseudomonas donghuensis]MBF4208854.1 LPS export ABC transporter periplasmic protein LptC [Pseudomonas donghuensis]MBS7599580.1 LPS export ABC transporter periplasmic protein LptC [Pseudomonas sp. RC2C2]MCP6691450.1 LPS export ABC transporter periplasmic protein LptC [